jgi:hypothetical protein
MTFRAQNNSNPHREPATLSPQAPTGDTDRPTLSVSPEPIPNEPEATPVAERSTGGVGIPVTAPPGPIHESGFEIQTIDGVAVERRCGLSSDIGRSKS